MGILVISTVVSFLLLIKVKHGFFNWILSGILLISSFILSASLFGGLLSLLLPCALLFVALLIGDDKSVADDAHNQGVKETDNVFDPFIFKNKKQNEPSPEDIDKYRELIRFISFAQKIAPFAAGNYGITITHEPEKSDRLYATFGFYDFNEIQFAREYAINHPHLKMAEFYYKDISKRAELSQDDWPYSIDAISFADVLRGEFFGELFTLIPDEHDDDINTFKIIGGFDGRNAIQSHKTIISILKSRFPKLKITQHFAHSFSMLIHIEI